MIELLRDNKPDRTPGIMTLEDGTEFCTMERPWIQNMQAVSCIPEGVYRLDLRDSNVINRTTKGKYLKGWEVTNVPNRSLIMIHIANFPYQLMGCIAVGMKHGFLPSRNGQEYAVLQSAIAFEKMMTILSARTEWFLEVKTK